MRPDQLQYILNHQNEVLDSLQAHTQVPLSPEDKERFIVAYSGVENKEQIERIIQKPLISLLGGGAENLPVQDMAEAIEVMPQEERVPLFQFDSTNGSSLRVTKNRDEEIFLESRAPGEKNWADHTEVLERPAAPALRDILNTMGIAEVTRTHRRVLGNAGMDPFNPSGIIDRKAVVTMQARQVKDLFIFLGLDGIADKRAEFMAAMTGLSSTEQYQSMMGVNLHEAFQTVDAEAMDPTQVALGDADFNDGKGHLMDSRGRILTATYEGGNLTRLSFGTGRQSEGEVHRDIGPTATLKDYLVSFGAEVMGFTGEFMDFEDDSEFDDDYDEDGEDYGVSAGEPGAENSSPLALTNENVPPPTEPVSLNSPEVDVNSPQLDGSPSGAPEPAPGPTQADIDAAARKKNLMNPGRNLNF